MDAKDDVVIALKIKEMMDKGFNATLTDFLGDWPFGRLPASSYFAKSGRKKIMSIWKSRLKDSGMRIVTEKGMKRDASDDIHVRDPSTDWRHAPFGGDPAYVKVPREVALKILVLGMLP